MNLISARFLLIVACSLSAATAAADPFQLSYSGRLTEPSGKPVVGPVDLQLKLFRDGTTDGSLIAVTIPSHDDVVLAQGVFNVSIGLDAAEYHSAFDGNDVWVEVKDVTHDKKYPRQRFMAVPYALKVPVDGTTITYDADGKLKALTGGGGNMNSAQYDANTDNKADVAELADVATTALDADELGGQLPAYYAAASDPRFTDARAPNGSAGGGLTGTYPNPTIAAVPDAALSAAVSKLGPSIDLASEVTGTLADGSLSAAVTKLGSTIALDSEVVNTLPVANGGTGATTLTGLIKGNGTGAFTAATLADVPVGYRLHASDGAPLDALYADNGGQVGIGTIAPNAQLEIKTPLTDANGLRITDGTNYTLASGYGGNGVGNFGGLAGSQLAFNTNATEKVRIDLNGNVGIGIALPLAKLHLLGDESARIERNNGQAYVQLYNNAAAPAADTSLGMLAFQGKDSTGAMHDYAAIKGVVDNSADGAERGYLKFETTADGVLAEKARIDTAGNLGIGVTPNEDLHLERTGANVYAPTGSGAAGAVPWTSADPVIKIRNASPTSGSGAYLSFYTTETGTRNNYNYIGSISRDLSYAPDLVFGVRGSNTTWAERMRLTGGGYLGVGTSSPRGPLHVVGPATQSYSLFQSSIGSGGTIFAASDPLPLTSSQGFIGYSGIALLPRSWGNATTADSHNVLYMGGAQRNLNSVASSIAFANWGYFTGNGSGAGELGNNTAKADAVKFLWQHKDLGSEFNQSLELTTKSASGTSVGAMTVLSNGNVGLGVNTPTDKLAVQGNASIFGNSPIFALAEQDSGGNLYHVSVDNNVLSLGRWDSPTSLNVISNGRVGIGTVGPGYTLHVVGDAGKTVGGTTWVSISDERLKDVEGTYDLGLEAIRGLQPVRFRYKDDNALGLSSAYENIGFVAQDVQQLIPDAVRVRPDGYLELNVDPIMWANVNATKELAEQVEDLRRENAELKAIICLDHPEAAPCKKD